MAEFCTLKYEHACVPLIFVPLRYCSLTIKNFPFDLVDDMTKQVVTIGETIAPNITRGSKNVAYEKGIHANSGDIAAQLVDTAIAADITPEQEKAVLRRVDMFLVPVMFLSFAFQFLDKACLTGAALFGILTDLDLLQM